MPAPSDAQAAGLGDAGSSGLLVEAMYQARDAAIDRMTAQCAALGGHGVVGVRLSRGRFPRRPGVHGYRHRGARAGRGGRPRRPFTSDLSGQDFARLIMAGWVPAGLALGIAVGSRHDDRATARQARPWSGNAEVAGWTELVNQSRKDARRRLESDIQAARRRGRGHHRHADAGARARLPGGGGPPQPRRGGHVHRHRHCQVLSRQTPSCRAGSGDHAARPAAHPAAINESPIRAALPKAVTQGEIPSDASAEPQAPADSERLALTVDRARAARGIAGSAHTEVAAQATSSRPEE